MASGHPKRWIHRNNAWYYQVPKADRHLWDGKTWFRLGKTDAEAYQTWFSRKQGAGPLRTMSQILDAYMADEVSQKAESTQKAYGYYVAALRASFGAMRPQDVRPIHAYQYLDGRPRVAGNREISVLTKALTYAVKKGVVERNLLKGQVEKNPEPSRKRLPEAAEIESFLHKANPTLRYYVALKRITGLRRGQLLKLTWEDWDGESLKAPGTKGGRDVVYHGEALEEVMGTIPRSGGNVFVRQDGEPYTPSGFSSIFKRQMVKFIQRGGEKFNEHDIRAHVASNADTLDHAQALLGHQDSRTTDRVYRRGAVRVKVIS